MKGKKKDMDYIENLKAALRALKDIDMNDFFEKAITEEIKEEESSK